MPETVSPQRGEVWRVELDPTLGSEQAKTRPVAVMSGVGVGRPSMRVCVPLMGAKPVHAALLWCVPISPSDANGLSKESTADASQIRALDVVRFVEKLGALEAEEVETITAAVSLCIV
jgi:mRNA interferase MazF